MSRTVARLLQERMGVAAAPPDLPMDSAPVVPRRRRRAAHRPLGDNGATTGVERAGAVLGARRSQPHSARPLPAVTLVHSAGHEYDARAARECARCLPPDAARIVSVPGHHHNALIEVARTRHLRRLLQDAILPAATDSSSQRMP